MSFVGLIASGGFDASAEKSDTTALTISAQGLYVGATGNVKVKTADGSVLTFVGVPTGHIIPFEIMQLYSTGTTATSLIGCRK